MRNFQGLVILFKKCSNFDSSLCRSLVCSKKGNLRNYFYSKTSNLRKNGKNLELYEKSYIIGNSRKKNLLQQNMYTQLSEEFLRYTRVHRMSNFEVLIFTGSTSNISTPKLASSKGQFKNNMDNSRLLQVVLNMPFLSTFSKYIKHGGQGCWKG